MKVTDYNFAQAIRFVDIGNAGIGTIYGINLVKAFEARYGFLQSPTIVSDFNWKTGITFLHGYFDKRLVIDKFQLFENGVLVEAKATTDDCTAFIDDVLNWASTAAGLAVMSREDSPQLFLSHLEVETTDTFSKNFNKYKSISNEISNCIISYKQPYSEFQFTGLMFGADILAPESNKIAFKFERRAGEQFKTNLYFSSSPLKTSDHIKVLNDLEKVFN